MINSFRIAIRSSFSRKKSKKLYDMGSQHVNLSEKAEESSAQIKKAENTMSIQDFRHQQILAEGWRTLSFDALCRLPTAIHQKIYYNIKKSKFDSTIDDLSKSIEKASENPQISRELLTMNSHYTRINELLSNQRQFDNIALKQERYLAQMEFDDLVEDQELVACLQKFLKYINHPVKLQGFVESNFVKHLLGINRDLKFRGVDLANIESEVSILKVLNFQYEFWVDISENRSKNHIPQEFFIYEKDIKNPNQSMLLAEHPTIRVKYIVRKRKNKDYEMCFCTKAEVLIEIDGNQHIAKVQWKGATQDKGNKNGMKASGREYKVIDFDFIYKGNPTIRPVFDF